MTNPFTEFDLPLISLWLAFPLSVVALLILIHMVLGLIVVVGFSLSLTEWIQEKRNS